MNARTAVNAKATPTPSKKLRLEALDEIALVVGDASLVLKKNGTIVIKGANIELAGSGKVTVKASGDLSLKGSKILNN